mmetsp:Transcript_48201/g.138690  ORF Transcript_48201/g.138690 Transcript_48201/m.138690 type:complete len:239 (+) Transcript_48201:69-785(+)
MAAHKHYSRPLALPQRGCRRMRLEVQRARSMPPLSISQRMPPTPIKAGSACPRPLAPQQKSRRTMGLEVRRAMSKLPLNRTWWASPTPKFGVRRSRSTPPLSRPQQALPTAMAAHRQCLGPMALRLRTMRLEVRRERSAPWLSSRQRAMPMKVVDQCWRLLALPVRIRRAMRVGGQRRRSAPQALPMAMIAHRQCLRPLTLPSRNRQRIRLEVRRARSMSPSSRPKRAPPTLMMAHKQ